MKNKQLIRLLLIQSAVTGLLSLIALLFHQTCAILVAICGVLHMICFGGYVLYRNYQIRKLSRYLQHVYTGGEQMDIRDNKEGELSTLKNDIYKVTLTLRSHLETAQKAKLSLSNALSDISHQLKTPLTSMFVMIDLLEDETLPPDKRGMFIKNITQQLQRLEWLVSSLLKLSKIDAGVIEFKKDRVQISELIQKAAEPLLVPMELKQQNFLVDCDPQITITMDGNWTAEAILNILKNCMEHTPVGGRITASCVQNPLHTELVITDTGDGIHPADLPYLFDRFYKGRNASEGSVGIGLAMSKSILKAQGFTVNVENQPEQGSRFMIRF